MDKKKIIACAQIVVMISCAVCGLSAASAAYDVLAAKCGSIQQGRDWFKERWSLVPAQIARELDESEDPLFCRQQSREWPGQTRQYASMKEVILEVTYAEPVHSSQQGRIFF